jgi:hypothetical protein
MVDRKITIVQTPPPAGQRALNAEIRKLENIVRLPQHDKRWHLRPLARWPDEYRLDAP